MDFQDVDEKSFSSWEDCIFIYDSNGVRQKKSHTGQLLWETKMENGGRENTRREQKVIRGGHACDLKNPERWASLRHAQCSYHLWVTRNQG